MPAPPIDPWTAPELAAQLHDEFGLTHLRVRKRGRLLTLESGPEDNSYPHARFRRDTINLWILEAPAGRSWQRTPFRATLDELVATLVEKLSWLVAPIE